MPSKLALGLAAFAAGACTTYGQEAARIRQGMLGLRAIDLRGCLPDPAEIRPEGETEIAIYRWEFTPRRQPRTDSPFADPPDVGDPDLTRERRRFLERGERPRHLAYCQMSFTLRGGRVAALEIDGRDLSGLNAESECLMQTRECVSPDDGSRPGSPDGEPGHP